MVAAVYPITGACFRPGPRLPAGAYRTLRLALAALAIVLASPALAQPLANPAESDLELIDRAPFPRLSSESSQYAQTVLLAEATYLGVERGFLAEPMMVSASTASQRTYGSMFLKAWVPMTAVEVALLGVTASLPKKWTGWSAHFVRDGVNHLGQAYTMPPVIDTDWWFHNYVGHPYGGSLYYNAVRSQGATRGQSTFFAFVLSTQWEYFFEAFAERPSIQDLIVTPVAGTVIGELSHRLTLHLKKGGTNTLEKVVILLTNPMHAAFAGF
ncbi:MAG: DUF3943 domain-containing protein [Candidatus Eiseniibacteriota bacterium]